MLSSIGLLHSFTENASKSICTVFAQHFSICVNICKCQSLLINITLLFMAITNTSSKKCQITENRYTIYLKEFKNKHRKSYLQKKKKKNGMKTSANLTWDENQTKNKIYFHVRVSKTCGRHWKIRITLGRKCKESRYWFWS